MRKIKDGLRVGDFIRDKGCDRLYKALFVTKSGAAFSSWDDHSEVSWATTFDELESCGYVIAEPTKRKIEDGLVEGDVIVNPDSQGDKELEIAGVCGRLIFSVGGNKLIFYHLFEDLVSDGYKLKTETMEAEIKEVTIQQVAEAMKIPVEKLRIKEEK